MEPFGGKQATKSAYADDLTATSRFIAPPYNYSQHWQLLSQMFTIEVVTFSGDASHRSVLGQPITTSHLTVTTFFCLLDIKNYHVVVKYTRSKPLLFPIVDCTTVIHDLLLEFSDEYLIGSQTSTRTRLIFVMSETLHYCFYWMHFSSQACHYKCTEGNLFRTPGACL